MFLKQTLFSVLLLVLLASAIAVGLSVFHRFESDTKVEHKAHKSNKPFHQTRLHVRRDIYGRGASRPCHTVLRCSEAELIFDLPTNELTEYMSGIEGTALHEDLQDTFSADVATYCHRRQRATASAFKETRFAGEHKSFDAHADYAEVWLSPEGVRFAGQNVHVQDGSKIPLSLNSHTASYDGFKLYLSGQVAVGLAAGSLLADSAVLDPKTFQGDFSGNLSVLMTSGAQLYADDCHVDRDQATAVFTAIDKVSYQEPSFESRKPLELTCRQLTIQTSPDHKGPGVNQITAQDEVEAIYDQGWELSADRAIYRSGANRQLILDADQHGGCVVTSPHSDHLVAKRIESTLASNQVTFHSLTGELRDGLTTLYADEASWNHAKSTLTCRRQARVHHKQHGALEANGDLKLIFQNDGTGLSLAKGHHQGSLHIQGTDKQLICHGECALDHQNKHFIINATEHTAVRLVDPAGRLDAQRLLLWYDWCNGNFATTRLKAEGQVQLQRVQDGILQLALADDLEYLPDQDKATLTARPPHRVLFYDPSRQMTASAKGVDIVRDPFTGKLALYGKGDVQFKLMEAELQAMRHYLQGIKNGQK